MVATVSSPAMGSAEVVSRVSSSLDEVRDVLGECTRCKLAGGRTHIVFGAGNPNADLMFVGEGPGRDEDLKAEPFVGRAGQLLTEIITKGMKLRREDVYIANVVKCRPPDNRNPEPDEIATCIPFLQQQIAAIRPRVIVALGKFAAHTLLGVQTPITRLRGGWHEYEGVRLMPTLHPAYLLRNPADKRLVWEDIKQVMEELGLPL
jgi:uracil-DNA glycosylase family 4